MLTMTVYITAVLILLCVSQACSRKPSRQNLGPAGGDQPLEQLRDEVESVKSALDLIRSEMTSQFQDVMLSMCQLAEQIKQNADTNAAPKNDSDSMGPFKIKYTVENLHTKDDQEFTAALLMKTNKIPFYDVMLRAAKTDDKFRFTSIDYPGIGKYITSVNGVTANTTASTFWAFIRRGCYECLMPVGMSSFLPSPGEHIVLSFKTYDIFNELPNCPPSQESTHSEL